MSSRTFQIIINIIGYLQLLFFLFLLLILAFLNARKTRVHHNDDKIASSEIIAIDSASKLKTSISK